MSNKRFLEIYSARRDRKRFPFISQFEIPIEQTGLRNTSQTALDPVIRGFPLYTFQLNTAGSIDGPYNFTGGTNLNPVLSLNSSNVNNFYVNYILFDFTISELTTITAYNGATRECTVNPPFSAAWNPNDTYGLIITQQFGSLSTPSNPQLNLNSADVDSQNFYNGYRLTNVSIVPPETRTITSYNGATQTCTLSYPFSSLNAGDRYYLSDPSTPIDTIVKGTVSGTNYNPIVTVTSISPLPNFKLTGIPNGYFTGFLIQIIDMNGLVLEERSINDFQNLGGGQYRLFLDNHFTLNRFTQAKTFKIQIYPFPFIQLQPTDIYNFRNPANSGGYFTGDLVYFEKTGEYKKITAYSDLLKIATLESGFSTWNPLTDFTALFSLRKDPPQARGLFPNNLNTLNKLYLDPTTSPSQNGVWDGFYLYIVPLGRCVYDIPGDKNVYRIQNYYGANPPPGQDPYSIFINGGIQNIPVPQKGDPYEILVFSYDNFSPFCYNGSTVSQNQEVCYEISLLSLVLPNTLLISGSRISFYPFLYVELSTLGSANNHSNCSIYSNNPPSNRALFITPITDVSNPLTTQFIKLDSSSMTQTVKFKPNDNLKFSVYLPNGELFLPIIQDDFSPLPPKLELQIEAVFSLKRLT